MDPIITKVIGGLLVFLAAVAYLGIQGENSDGDSPFSIENIIIALILGVVAGFNFWGLAPILMTLICFVSFLSIFGHDKNILIFIITLLIAFCFLAAGGFNFKPFFHAISLL